jgi:hypothetical protein
MEHLANRKIHRFEGLFCIVFGVLVLGAGIFTYLTLGPRGSLGDAGGFAVLLFAILFGGALVVGGVSCLWYLLFPRRLVLHEDGIELLRGSQVLGRIPLATLEAIRVHNVEWRPDMGVLTDIEVIGKLVAVFLVPIIYLRNPDRKPAGLRVRLLAGGEAGTFWPGLAPSRRTRDVLIRGPWDQELYVLRDIIQKAQHAYREAHGLPSLEREDSADNPFDLS